MKPASFIVCLLLLFLLRPGYSFSQENSVIPERYLCFRADTIPLIDGEIDEPAWKQAPWSAYFTDIEGRNQESPYLDTRMKMLWDDEHLYIAALLEEPHIWASLTKRDAIIYRDNDFEVFIDPDGDGLNYYELEVNAFGTEMDLFMNKPYNEGGTADLDWDFECLETAVKVYGSLNDPADLDKKWTVEMAIPWEAISDFSPGNRRPGRGEEWRMNFSRVQWETRVDKGNYVKKTDPVSGEPMPENNWVWSPQGVINMHQPETWAYVKFCEKQACSEEKESPDRDIPQYWVWMGANTEMSIEYWDSAFKRLHETGITGVLIGADTALLEKIIPRAESQQVEVHAWFWTMNRQEADPDWLSVNKLGKSLAEEKAYVNYYKFMCPALPQVRAYLAQKIEGLCSVEGLRGVHMDYIRYVDAILPVGLQPKYDLVQDHVMPEFDYGYHPYMRSLFEDSYGVDPFEIQGLRDQEQWLRFRLDMLNEAVEGIRDRVRCNDKIISAAVFPTPAMSREMVRQEWDRWQLDYFFPMVYNNFYNEPPGWIREVMTENRNSLAGSSKIFCGLYLPGLKDNDDLTQAMNAALAGGADGIAFFNYGALDEKLLKQVREFILDH